MLELAKNRWTVTEVIREQAKRYGEREFLRHEDGSTLSFADLENRSAALAAGLARLGVKRGDRVLAFLFNHPSLLLVLAAANRLGAIFVPINTELKGAFLQHQVRNSSARVVVADAALLPTLAAIDLDACAVETVLTVGTVEAGHATAFGRRAVLPLDAMFERGASSTPAVEPTARDISTVIYTSGTTGPSKGVLMPHAHCYLLGRNLARVLELTEDDIYYVCMPLFHTNALFMQVLGSLLAGARVALVRRFSASRWLDDVRRYRATVTNALGVMPEFIYRQPPTPYDRDNSLRKIMAVPIAREWGADFEARFGVSFVQGFGLTESNILCYTSPDERLEPGCCGRVLDEWFEVKIVDPETDEELPTGQAGEIVVRPKHPWCFMAGYLDMPERTVEAWRNLWFHTGDAGRFDERGRLFFIDRIKDCIRRRGENISSYEVEQVLNTHPAVAESAVVGVPSAVPGGEEEIKAYIVSKPGAKPAPEHLVAFCVERMPRFAVPRYIEFVDELPKTETGKVKKQELRSRGITAETWDGGETPRRR